MFIKEFNLNGYGISDILLLQYKINNKKRIVNKIITSFEVKIYNWRRALAQAYRYKYYSHRVIVIIPSENVIPAVKNLYRFKALEVGLWTFDSKLGLIHKFYTPRIRKSKSKNH